MKFERDFNGTFSCFHTIEADTPEEAAKKYRETMQEAMSAAAGRGWNPDKDDTLTCLQFWPEHWRENLHFFSDGTQYDADGKAVPEPDGQEDGPGGDYAFLWGVRAADDLSEGDANSHTMNDIDVVYYNGQYRLSIEEIYRFDTEEDRIRYLEYLAGQFRTYVLSKGYTEEVKRLQEM